MDAMALSIDIDHKTDAPARAPAKPVEKTELIGLDREELGAALAGLGIPAKHVRMRVSQIWHWLYVRGASDFADMHNVARDLRERLDAAFTIARPEIIEEQVSTDGTCKWLMRLPSRGAGRPVEVETV